MTDEHIRLYALARIAVPSQSRIRTLAEPTTGGQVMYTIQVKTPYRAGPERFFGIHSSGLVASDAVLLSEIRRAVKSG